MPDQGRPFFFIWSGALAPPAARCGARAYKEGPLRSKPNPTPQARARGRDFLLFGAAQARRLPRAAAREAMRNGLYVLNPAQGHKLVRAAVMSFYLERRRRAACRP